MVIREPTHCRAGEPGNRELDSGNGIQCGYQLSCDGKCDLLGYAEQPESGRVQGAGKRCSCLEWLFRSWKQGRRRIEGLAAAGSRHPWYHDRGRTFHLPGIFSEYPAIWNQNKAVPATLDIMWRHIDDGIK